MIQSLQTKDMIMASLKELVHEKRYEEITVAEIAQNCGISRRSFYHYFPDKYAVASAIYQRDTEIFRKNYKSNETWSSAFQLLLNYLCQEEVFYMNVLQYKGQNSLHDYIYHDCIHFAEQKIAETHNLPLENSLQFQIKLYFHGMVIMSEEWIMNPNRCSAAKFTNMIHDSMPEQLKKLLD